MKALIISDVHSNIHALEAVWAQERDSDLVYCAGDLVDYGPYPQEVLTWIRAHRVHCVQGNHDKFVAFCYRSRRTLERTPVQERAWVHHNASLLSEQDIVFLEQLPQALTFELDGIAYGLTHAYQDYQEITNIHTFEQFSTQTFGASADGPISRLIFGHTHRLGARYLTSTLLCLNPGSVSYRRADDPDQSAHYITITDGVFALKRLPYDLEPLRRAVCGVSLKPSEQSAADRFFGLREVS